MCSAAATLDLTTSQFAMTKVFGTLPSVWPHKRSWIKKNNQKKEKNLL